MALARTPRVRVGQGIWAPRLGTHPEIHHSRQFPCGQQGRRPSDEGLGAGAHGTGRFQIVTAWDGGDEATPISLGLRCATGSALISVGMPGRMSATEVHQLINGLYASQSVVRELWPAVRFWPGRAQDSTQGFGTGAHVGLVACQFFRSCQRSCAAIWGRHGPDLAPRRALLHPKTPWIPPKPCMETPSQPRAGVHEPVDQPAQRFFAAHGGGHGPWTPLYSVTFMRQRFARRLSLIASGSLRS